MFYRSNGCDEESGFIFLGKLESDGGKMEKMKNITQSSEYKKIENDIENFVKSKLQNYIPADTGKKTIHDPVWGSIDYSEWEMQIIDSPLFQRLRDINQVGLAMLTYPAARHSRFEHSLGVASAAKIMCDKIDKNSDNFKIPEKNKNAIILAALLHDIGHCFYSHLSETIYGELKDFVEVRNKFYEVLELRPKPHEIFSFMIVNTATFKNFFFKYVNYPEKGSVKKTLFTDIGCMIIGKNIKREGRIQSYQTALINGPFDADKLDYIKRDSLTAGLTLQYDMERLFTKIQVHSVASTGSIIEDRLVINFNGITAIEELTFCKIMLFSYIYYHQKVLISETMIKDYAFGLYKLNLIKSFSDFLQYTDSDILKLGKEQSGQNPFPEYGMLNLEELADNIHNRKLPRRCFEVSQGNVVSIKPKNNDTRILEYCSKILEQCQDTSQQYTADDLKNALLNFSTFLMKDDEIKLDNLVGNIRDMTYTEMLKKRKEFYDEFVKEYQKQGKNINFTLFDIYIVFPKLVNYGAANEEVVLGKDHSKLMTINEFVKLDHWASSFNSNKWRGYIFVSDKIDKSIAFEVSERLILKGKAKLKNPMAYLKDIDC